LTTPALRDLQEIRQYVERDSPRRAQEVIRRIVAAARRLESFPLSGRAIPLPGRADIREILADRYRIIYQVTRSEVRVMMVHHTARELDLDELRSRL